MLLRTLVLMFSLINVTLAEHVSYDGYKVFRITPKTVHDIYLLNLFKTSTDFDFWSETNALHCPIDIMVAPKSQKKFVAVLDKYHIIHKVVISNVENCLKRERANQQNADNELRIGHLINFKRFHRYHYIVQYLKKLAKVYRHKVKLRVYGYSSEGRPLYVLRIGNDPLKPTILIEGGMHGREWISPAVVTYIISQVVERNKNKDLVKYLNWVLAPLVNPDGYEFTHTTDRFWRKTRSNGIICDGVDGNRNFPFHWMGEDSSTDECSQRYAGSEALSEPETDAFANLTIHIKNLQLFVSIHGFGPWLLYPRPTTFPAKGNLLYELGQSFIDTIYYINYTKYRDSQHSPMVYYGSGNTVDWVRSLGVDLSYFVGVPSLKSAHEHPSRDIVPLANEIWHGIQVFCNYLIDRDMFL